MKKPVTGQHESQEGTAAERPATDPARAPFADAFALNPLMAQSAAAMAAATALGMTIAGQFAGAFFGALQGAMEAQNRLDTGANRQAAEPKEAPVRAEAQAPSAEATEPKVKRKPEPPKPAVEASRTARKPRATKPVGQRSTTTKAAGNLKQISGIGPKLEKVLNDMGVTRVDQIAAWTADEVTRFDEALGLDGRIDRDDWVGQAKKLAK
ncbi:NADH-quinone oxidoreductase subunit E [Pseudorhizobium tarimense]|uniref:NADH-quinone oxidoreductase subunit E n=1 Tax=Pseudorhizobium tarimense TaxID=1079109 RepID=A0ABV2H571_9HYPH|nr:hypothetical protein [Pseudorhizobium tarimense]MCJ8518907.1 hypothetical protein [Pseudorhizobium tarimense]